MVPGELTHFKPLLAELGVRDRFNAEQYANVLAEMAETTSKRRLFGAELQQALSIVQVSGWALLLAAKTIFLSPCPNQLLSYQNHCT